MTHSYVLRQYLSIKGLEVWGEGEWAMCTINTYYFNKTSLASVDHMHET